MIATTCRIFGHVPKAVPGRSYTVLCRDGVLRMQQGFYMNCSRCGIGEGECFEPGAIEKLHQLWHRFLSEMERTKEAPPELEDDGLPF